MCVMSLWFLAVVETHSDVGQSPLSFRGVVCTFISPTSPVVMGTWGICRQEGKAKPGSRRITVKGCGQPLLQMCVAPESAFPTRVFSLSGTTPHILCCVYEKESIGKEHFRKHSDLSRFLESVAIPLSLSPLIILFYNSYVSRIYEIGRRHSRVMFECDML